MVFSQLICQCFVRLSASAVALVLCAHTATAAVELRSFDDQVFVTVDGQQLAIYDVNPHNPRPYFRNITVPSGALISRPIAPPGGDHPHHTGLWIAVDEVNGIRFWHREGKIRNTSVKLLESNSNPAVMQVENEWLTHDGLKLLHETTIIRIFENGLFSYHITLSAGEHPITFDDTEEGFLAFRMAESMKEKETGRVTNADGLTTSKGCWGKNSDWVNYTGKVSGETVGVAIFDHPLNFRSSRYHVRDYGVFAISPFGEEDYTKGEQPASPLTLEPKTSLQLRYGIYFYSGDSSSEQVANVYRRYLEYSHSHQRLQEIQIRSSADGALQPAMFHAPEKGESVPLLVTLHTWSGDYRQRDHLTCAEWCVDRGWAYIHPHFRGKNVRPQATGSELVVQDILDAVRFAQERAEIDSSRIYLLGTSGGGHAALLMAGRYPEIWAGVSAWVPIVDLKAWYEQTKLGGRNYWQNIADSCGGAPRSGPEVDEQYRRRSPLFTLQHAKNVPMDINAGIRDGHEGSVPINHALWAFNRLARPEDHLSYQEIEEFVSQAVVPAHLKQKISDPTYGDKQPLFRRTSRNVRVTIFDGGHESIQTAALEWLDQQRKVEP